jgi:hypothetical protein
VKSLEPDRRSLVIIVGPKQLDEGIGDTLVLVDATRGVGRSKSIFSRLASWAEAATVTDPQWRLVGPGKSSINSNSLIQSSAASLACSGPNNSVTAPMKAPNSRSAIAIRSTSAPVFPFIKWDRLPFVHRSSRFLKPESRAPAISQLRLSQKSGRKPIRRRYRLMFPPMVVTHRNRSQCRGVSVAGPIPKSDRR